MSDLSRPDHALNACIRPIRRQPPARQPTEKTVKKTMAQTDVRGGDGQGECVLTAPAIRSPPQLLQLLAFSHQPFGRALWRDGVKESVLPDAQTRRIGVE